MLELSLVPPDANMTQAVKREKEEIILNRVLSVYLSACLSLTYLCSRSRCGSSCPGESEAPPVVPEESPPEPDGMSRQGGAHTKSVHCRWCGSYSIIIRPGWSWSGQSNHLERVEKVQNRHRVVDFDLRIGFASAGVCEMAAVDDSPAEAENI